jgi:hypothetical protein
MNVEILTLCDFASADQGGKLTIVGSFDHIWSVQAPIVYPLCALAAKLRFRVVEQEMKKIRISFIDSDGKSVMPIVDMPIPVRVQPGESTASVPFVMIIQQLKLPRFGEYSIDLAIDGMQQTSIPLFAQPVQLPPQMQQGQLPAAPKP